jgi:L-lactate utilization protein LutB
LNNYGNWTTIFKKYIQSGVIKVDAKFRITEMQVKKTIENLKKNNMQACFVHSRSEVADKVAELINEGDTVAVGGSVTLFETGVIDLLRNGKYNFIDRYAQGVDTRQIFLDSFSADVYLASSNAVTMKGELYNVDGNSNRVAAILYGPPSVILIVGHNKIVPDLKAAVRYVKQISAPANAVRLNCQTYCASAGVCQGMDDDNMTSGCGGNSRICCNYVVCARQRVPGRIKVIIVGEPCGY